MPPDAALFVALHLPGAIVHHPGSPSVFYVEPRGAPHIKRGHVVIGVAPHSPDDLNALVLNQVVGGADVVEGIQLEHDVVEMLGVLGLDEGQ